MVDSCDVWVGTVNPARVAIVRDKTTKTWTIVEVPAPTNRLTREEMGSAASAVQSMECVMSLRLCGVDVDPVSVRRRSLGAINKENVYRTLLGLQLQAKLLLQCGENGRTGRSRWSVRPLAITRWRRHGP